ncbi:acyl-CoA dehydrogenase [Massilia sp. CFBP9012]|uniref:acyl-CoA dehydrogenase n=1 Tax=Massilia sp. CFBP9012 TaxID=3096531 RepID=UPI002A6B1830|nr:acyl-CoA dehydrogenase [Massilia sp. CFBP9012]MDY0975635.1 acyl-CoA dehydrogenase [Massilia sp. CFBP9012]
MHSDMTSVGAPLMTLLPSALASLRDAPPAAALKQLATVRLDRLPLPGHGATLDRWRALAAVGAHDLALAKLFEGHTDALAILHEAGAHGGADDALWATWCAEPPDARLALSPGSHGGHRLDGRKAWCSGARDVSHAVVSCWSPDGAAMLAAVDLRHAGVTVSDDGWHAVGMAASGSVDVRFDGVEAQVLGGPGFYVERAGFWHGGAGVAACWFGAATRLADALRERVAGRGDPHRLAQLGDAAVALQGSAALMREAAARIDRSPQANAMGDALSVRLSVEASAGLVLAAAGRALGAGPLCKDAALARLYADLPVFMRQSHAERDLEALGRMVSKSGAAPWTL